MGSPPLEREGVVELRLLEADSKSEHTGPVLVDAEGTSTPLHLKGDNPFEEPTFRALAGRRLSVKGRLRAGIFVVNPGDWAEVPAPKEEPQ